ncbi:hypothetical protein HN011_004108 [Eciton burchellii]|nr:hypothetical protein HN011_004108 [Eciton burchellii]
MAPHTRYYLCRVRIVARHAVAINEATGNGHSRVRVRPVPCIVWDGIVHLIPIRIVRCALIAPRVGRCNSISAGWGGRLAAGWRFNRISICLVAASQCRRRYTVVPPPPPPPPPPPLPPPPLSLLLLPEHAQTRSAHTAYRVRQFVRRYGNSYGCRYFWGTAMVGCAVCVHDRVPDGRRDVT